MEILSNFDTFLNLKGNSSKMSNKLKIPNILIFTSGGGGGGGGLKPVHFSFSELWAKILNTKRCAIYETEAIEKRFLVWKFQDFS
jgi:hypothetical protein